MKRAVLYLFILPAVVLAASGGMSCLNAGEGPVPVVPQGFGAALDSGYCYDYLAPFGTWVRLDPWGFVWCPRHMGYGWRPYCDGRWLWTDFGWTWFSDYDWGWMPFHYGRWGWDDDCGWFWVPGTVWGPAWVTWRWGDLYFGWAPIPPGFDFRPGIDFDAVALGIPLNFWVFLRGSRFLDRDLRPYVLPYERNLTVVSLTKLRNDFEFSGGRLVNRGIDLETVRRITRRTVTPYSLADSDRPGAPVLSGRSARFYRPAIREAPDARPRQFLGRDEARRELAPARIFEPRRREPAAEPDSLVRRRQAEERSRLMRSQSQERKDLERRQSAETRKIRDAEARTKAQQEGQARVAEQRKRHQEEQQKMSERHQKEAERVRQSGQSKQPPPPPRKKK